MEKMRNTVDAYIEAGERLFAAFGCAQHYYIRPMPGCPWQVLHGEIPILSYERNGAHNAVIVRQDGRPLIYRAGGYALVIAIDCVKIAFLLDELKERKA